MRLGWFVLFVAFFAPISRAQEAISDPAPPHRSYAAPPQTLELPQRFDVESLRAVAGNVARWRDHERQRIGPYRSDAQGQRQVVDNALPPLGGYFAFFGDDRSPAGVVEARWEDPDSGIGESSTMTVRYAAGRSVCGGAAGPFGSEVGSLTFLGSQWRPEFEALDADLRALVAVPSGRTLPAGVGVPLDVVSDFSRFYPIRALEGEIEGMVMLGCFVRTDLSVLCGVISETPAGWGFAEAAHRIFRRARVQPRARNGEPSAGVCTLFAVPFRLK